MTYVSDHIARGLTPAAARAAVTSGDVDDGQPGIMVPTGRGWTPGVANLSTASLGRFLRFRPLRDITPITVAFALTVNTAPNNETCEIWITDSAGVKLFTTGSTAGILNAGAAVVKTAAFVSPQVLKAGTVYYAAMTNSYTGTTAPQIVTATFQDVSTRNLYGTTIGTVRFGTQASVAPGSSPSTLTPDGTAAAAAMPLLVLRES